MNNDKIMNLLKDKTFAKKLFETISITEVHTLIVENGVDCSIEEAEAFVKKIGDSAAEQCQETELTENELAEAAGGVVMEIVGIGAVIGITAYGAYRWSKKLFR